MLLPGPLLPHGRFLGEPIGVADYQGLATRTSRYEAQQRLAPHSHATDNFCLVLRGRFVHHSSSGASTHAAGDAAFWATGLPHAQVFGDDGGVCFNISMTREWMSRYGIEDVLPRQHRSLSQPAAGLCVRIYRELARPDALSRVAVEGLALQLVADLARTARPRVTPDATLIARAVEIIDADPSRPTSITGLAAKLKVEPAVLARAFRANAGCTVLAFVHARRMTRAQRLLCETTESVGQIAARLGYFDQSHFTHTFRRSFGVTPGEYRRLVLRHARRTN